MNSKKIKKNKKFKLKTNFSPSGDQPKAIQGILDNLQKNIKNQVLLGVTGSGKTFTMANVIAKINEPTLILAHNKTLAAQLFAEFKKLFPENKVEYFVSYYDYYQPEAYIPTTKTYIEKDASINEQIDRMRHSATKALFECNDVIIVSSVSCIYGLGSPQTYEDMIISLKVNDKLKRDNFLRMLIRNQYVRSIDDFSRGYFRVRGDIVEVFPPDSEDRVIRIEFFGDYVDNIFIVDSLSSRKINNLNSISIYPGSHYVTDGEISKKAIKNIQEELKERLEQLNKELKFEEAKRLEKRTYYDIEMIEEMGFCSGIENYSRHFTGRESGMPPPTLLEYFPDSFLLFVDESHVTIPQIRGMYYGDKSRKETLVSHGFRLPSALDNRPLNFQEFEEFVDKVIYVSATPGDYEYQKSNGIIVEQIIRPTGLCDPEIEVKPVKSQVNDLLKEIKKRIVVKERILVTTLTKKSSEDLSEYYDSLGIKVKYLHSDINTIERTEIIRDLRLGIFDVLIGINLLREGLDLPEVSLVAIMDADKEGFLRSERSLIQTIGRAARHLNGKVILYAEYITASMRKAIEETNRRRKIQENFNKKHKIIPKSIVKDIDGSLIDFYQDEVNSLMNLSSDDNKINFDSSSLNKQIQDLKKKMRILADELQFEEAAKLRDEIKRLEIVELMHHN